MHIQKIYENTFNNNDIYTLEIQNSYIVINNNDRGISLLDYYLNFQKTILIKKNTSIYFLYKEFEENCLASYSPDQGIITIINTSNGKTHSIYIAPLINEYTFSSIYYWKNNIFILTTYNHLCYQVCLTSYILKEISEDEIKKIDPHFFNFWNKSKNYTIATSYSKEYSFIFKKDDVTIGFFSVEKNKKYFVQNFETNWHDIEYCNDTFIFIYEKKLKIIYNYIHTVLQPNFGYIFLKAKFITPTNIVILSSKPSNYNDSMVQIYQLQINSI